MDLKEVHKQVGKMKRMLFKRSNAFAIGVLKSSFRGSGLQFKEHQVYAHGDDVRFIDWKLTAKTNMTFVKTFEEERNVEINILLDLSETMFIGHNGVTKLQAALEIICLLYLLSKETNDRVRIIILGEEVWDIPFANGDQGIIRLFKFLEDKGILDEKGRVNRLYPIDHPKLQEISTREILLHLKRSREVIILSDYYRFPKGDDLRRILHQRNVHAFRLLCDLDKGDKVKFFIDAFKHSSPISVNTLKENEMGLEGLHVKDLWVSEEYLDNFIRVMTQ